MKISTYSAVFLMRQIIEGIFRFSYSAYEKMYLISINVDLIEVFFIYFFNFVEIMEKVWTVFKVCPDHHFLDKHYLLLLFLLQLFINFTHSCISVVFCSARINLKELFLVMNSLIIDLGRSNHFFWCFCAISVLSTIISFSFFLQRLILLCDFLVFFLILDLFNEKFLEGQLWIDQFLFKIPENTWVNDSFSSVLTDFAFLLF